MKYVVIAPYKNRTPKAHLSGPHGSLIFMMDVYTIFLTKTAAIQAIQKTVDLHPDLFTKEHFEIVEEL